MIERHQLAATGLFLAAAATVLWRDGPSDIAVAKILILFVVLLTIWFYRIFAWLASFGFPEYFARDFGSKNHPGPYAFFFWIIFLIFWAFFVFNWSLW